MMAAISGSAPSLLLAAHGQLRVTARRHTTVTLQSPISILALHRSVVTLVIACWGKNQMRTEARD
ncbi:hypothetical protein E2C01_068250 [Portunus trituberculatus]|uniref:Uncharacterized protein n=1 Tax=Portunus trituberculatus TaxID=210409 RepID=A0A5B7HYX2_PORTR|nr:hypothetical protein [Portunus trituberculatus]